VLRTTVRVSENAKSEGKVSDWGKFEETEDLALKLGIGFTKSLVRNFERFGPPKEKKMKIANDRNMAGTEK